LQGDFCPATTQLEPPHQQSFQGKSQASPPGIQPHAALPAGAWPRPRATARDRPYYTTDQPAAPVYSRGWACPCPGVGPGNRLEQLEQARFGDGLRAALHVQFAIQIGDVFLDRVHTEHQLMSDLAVGGPIQQH